MPLIAEYAKRFGIYDELPPYLSFALGAGETTLLRMVTAYAMFDNGGRRVKPTLIDRIQDRYGHTIYKHDERECRGCNGRQMGEPGRAGADRSPRAGARSDDGLSDHLDDGRRRRCAAPASRSCARSASRSPARPAPPTTTRMPGSSASRPISWSASTSATTSRSIWRSRAARPAAISLRRSSRNSSKTRLRTNRPRRSACRRASSWCASIPRAASRAGPGTASILEAFKPGTAPPDNYSVVGYGEAQIAVRSGCHPGGLRPRHPWHRRALLTSSHFNQDKKRNARGNPDARRRDQAVPWTAEEASLTSTQRHGV